MEIQRALLVLFLFSFFFLLIKMDVDVADLCRSSHRFFSFLSFVQKSIHTDKQTKFFLLFFYVPFSFIAFLLV